MSIFDKMFHPKKLNQAVDLSVLKADMHSHYIPGIDDGAVTMDESVAMLKEMYNLGYRKIITTPHIQGEIFKNTPEIIMAGLADLKEALQADNVQMEVEAAAEYLLDDYFEEKLKNKNLLTFGDNYILVECSYFSPHPNLLTFIFNLQIEGYKVILAHPERYSYWFNNFREYEDLKDRGVFFQLNTISLCGYYDNLVKKNAEKIIDAGMIDFLGSDMHNFNYLNALKNTQHEKYLAKVLESNKILNNTL